MKRISPLCLATALLGCEPPVQPAQVHLVDVASDPGITVECIGTFDDQLAYRGERGIYRIHDARTGREFIGISGIGISSNGRVTHGKTIEEVDQ